MKEFFNMYNYRKTLHIPLDPFDDFKLKDTEEDRILIMGAAKTIKDISKICFRKCANINYETYTKYEKNCTIECLNLILKSTEKIISNHKEKE